MTFILRNCLTINDKIRLKKLKTQALQALHQTSMCILFKGCSLIISYETISQRPGLSVAPSLL